jgi:hypothetical protein
VLFEKLYGRSAWEADRTDCQGLDSTPALYLRALRFDSQFGDGPYGQSLFRLVYV